MSQLTTPLRADPEWWRKNYLNTDYLVSHQGRDGNEVRAEVQFILAATGVPPDRKVVDLACAEGTHANHLASLGYSDVVGVDLSPFMVERAEAAAPAPPAPRPRFACRDMRSCEDLLAGAGLVQILYNSIGFFDAEADHDELFAAVAKALAPNGSFFLDVFPAEHLLPQLRVGEVRRFDRETVTVDEQYDPASRRLVRRTRVERRSAPVSERVSSQRIFELAELLDRLRAAGFSETHVYADFEFRPYDPARDRRACLIARHGS